MYTSAEILEIVNNYISNLPYERKPMSLYDPIKYVLAAGGKRIRPCLVLMAYNLFRDDVLRALPVATAIETYHNFTLLHDDLMDNADVRRGRPTVHRKWDANQAILSGDTMLCMAFLHLSQFCPPENGSAPDSAQADFSDRGQKDNWTTENPAVTPSEKNIQSEGNGIQKRLTDVFVRTALEVSEGQQLDMEFETRNDVTEEEYIEMIRLKTSVLLACALKMGAIAAGATEEDSQQLYDFGEKIGLAFQLQDDLLDVYGDPKVFGKAIGGDITSNKKTYMLINAQRLAKGETKQELDRWLQTKDFNKEEKIKAVTEIYNKLGIREMAERKIEEYFEEGKRKINLSHCSLSHCSADISVLLDYANKMMKRQK